MKSTRRHFISTYARRVLEKKACGYWRLGEKAGPVIVYASVSGHDGAALGQVVFGQKGMLDREAETALVFDGKKELLHWRSGRGGDLFACADGAISGGQLPRGQGLGDQFSTHSSSNDARWGASRSTS